LKQEPKREWKEPEILNLVTRTGKTVIEYLLHKGSASLLKKQAEKAKRKSNEVLLIRSETMWSSHPQKNIDRTSLRSKAIGWRMIRGEMLIEHGDSWLITKII